MVEAVVTVVGVSVLDASLIIVGVSVVDAANVAVETMVTAVGDSWMQPRLAISR